MKTQLNCDDIFERLTAGPVPQGSDVACQVQEHIQDCDACRDFANAMRPALHLIHESLPQEQREGLPVFASTDEEAIERVMDRVRAAPQQKTRTTTMKSVLCLAAGLAYILSGPWLYESQVEANGKPYESLAAMNLPQDCFDISIEQTTESSSPDQSKHATDHASLTMATLAGYECCTRCHSEHSETRIESASVSQLLLACSHCHPDV